MGSFLPLWIVRMNDDDRIPILRKWVAHGLMEGWVAVLTFRANSRNQYGGSNEQIQEQRNAVWRETSLMASNWCAGARKPENEV
ncbi:hypothetical protein RB195_012486 [Necator americanus]|uniref:Uncharacterized protein n=1 Tax=Necator americanus TaxID=51031 RepID=A0ABR1D7C1_NECAM